MFHSLGSCAAGVSLLARRWLGWGIIRFLLVADHALERADRKHRAFLATGDHGDWT